jgi:hypothetical protein
MRLARVVNLTGILVVLLVALDGTVGGTGVAPIWIIAFLAYGMTFGVLIGRWPGLGGRFALGMNAGYCLSLVMLLGGLVALGDELTLDAGARWTRVGLALLGIVTVVLNLAVLSRHLLQRAAARDDDAS